MADTTQTSLARRSPLPSPVWLARSWTSRMKEGEPHLYVVLGRWVLVGLLSPVCTTSEQRQHAARVFVGQSLRTLLTLGARMLTCLPLTLTGANGAPNGGPVSGRKRPWEAAPLGGTLTGAQST
eukprot:scaffold28587_cov63-Phaeocystis_antarctica.AAC.1